MMMVAEYIKIESLHYNFQKLILQTLDNVSLFKTNWTLDMLQE